MITLRCHPEKNDTYLPDPESGLSMKREWGLTPNGNEMGGRWVLRDKDGKIIDFDSYRNDIAERNNISLQGC